MIFDDDTLDALGYGEALDLRDARDSDVDRFVTDAVDNARGRVSRLPRNVVLVAHMTDEQRRAYRREKKAAWRARRPDLSHDADRRARRAAGCVPMAVHLRRVGAAAMSASERETKRRWAARWRARLLSVSAEGFAERVAFGMDVAAREVA